MRSYSFKRLQFGSYNFILKSETKIQIWNEKAMKSLYGSAIEYNTDDIKRKKQIICQIRYGWTIFKT